MVQGAAAQADRMSYGIRHCERSEAIQSGLRTLWIAASPSAPRNDEGLFRRRLVGLFPRACPRIEELAPIGLGHILVDAVMRSEEHTSELQSLMRISYAVFCLKKKKINTIIT